MMCAYDFSGKKALEEGDFFLVACFPVCVMGLEFYFSHGFGIPPMAWLN
jgi:hypothetical protein